MQLTDDEVKEFIRIWKEEFKEDLPEGKARIRVGEVLELYRLLAQPFPSERAPSEIPSVSKTQPSSIPTISPPIVADIIEIKKPEI